MLLIIPVLDTSHYKVRPRKGISGIKGTAGLKQFEKNQFDEYIELGLFDAFRNFILIVFLIHGIVQVIKVLAGD